MDLVNSKKGILDGGIDFERFRDRFNLCLWRGSGETASSSNFVAPFHYSRNGKCFICSVPLCGKHLPSSRPGGNRHAGAARKCLHDGGVAPAIALIFTKSDIRLEVFADLFVRPGNLCVSIALRIMGILRLINPSALRAIYPRSLSYYYYLL